MYCVIKILSSAEGAENLSALGAGFKTMNLLSRGQYFESMGNDLTGQKTQML